MNVHHKRLLVTGSTGFVAAHVREACTAAGVLSDWEFHGNPPGWDIRDRQAVRELVEQVRPDAVLHLAAQSFVPRSFEAPQETIEINVVGTANLLQALKGASFEGRFILASSGDVFGRVPDDALPVNEMRVPEPRSPYAVSKIAAEQLCLQWHRTEGLDVVIARPFNHVGPGQDARFVLPALARQVVAIAAGRREPVIEAGDVSTTRDFTDVRDVVGAYAAMLAQGAPGTTYLVASGVERRVSDLLKDLCRLAGVDVEIRQDPTRTRPAEQRRMVADAGRLRADTGWRPRIPFESTLTDILNDARKDI